MSPLNLLLVHADDRKPVLAAGLSGQAGSPKDKPESPGQPSHLGDDAGDQNDLERQRWGVIAPQGPLGDRLLALIDPLIKARSAAQGGREVRIYRTPSAMDMAAAADWKKKNFDTAKDTTEDLPRYQLILGDLDQVPLAIQQVQGADNYVGRLAFSDDQGYQAYVDKLLRWEKSRSAVTQARSVLFTVHDQTAATESGYRYLVAPGLEVARKRKALSQFNASEILELGDATVPSPDELLRAVSKPEPAMLFTLSHGLGAPRGGWRSVEDQRRRQGAMSFGSEGTLSAQELGSQPFLPGGVWFMLACYGAGTPEASAYKQWLEELAKVGQFRGQPQAVLAGLPKPGDRPFIAALPQAVLRNDQGPLAFMGHVDLAWTYGFAELDSGQPDPKPGRFMEILRYVLKRDRVGVAFRSLTRYFAAVDVELNALYSRDRSGQPEDPAVVAKRSHLWMLRQDLAGYVLLGDPAAQLPLQPRSEGQLWPPPPPIGVPPPPERLERLAAQEVGFSVSIPSGNAAPVAPTTSAIPSAPAQSTTELPPVPLPAAIERLEEAFGQMLSGERSLKDVALDLQLSRSEMQRLFDLYRQGGRRALGMKT